MRLRTLIRFLLGDRAAILELATNRWSLVVGFLFVVSAAFAREYDGKDLLAEPSHLLMPLSASLAASFILFAFTCRSGHSRAGQKISFSSAYASFLGLFWLTAPLAWLYAIPYERIGSPLWAAQMNLMTLGLVAAWRVFLMIRVLMVVMNYTALFAVLIVITIGDALAVIALMNSSVGLMSAMGGIHAVSESDRFIAQVGGGIFSVGFCGFPFFVVATMIAAMMTQPYWQAEPGSWAGPARPNVSVWGFVIASIAVWVVVLPFTQPEQQLRTRVEDAFNNGRIADALAEMSEHAPTDFPAQWEPPPKVVSHWQPYAKPTLVDICRQMEKQPTALWVRELYLNKFREWLCHGYLDDQDQIEAAQLLQQLSDGPALFAAMKQARNEEFVKKMRQYMDHFPPVLKNTP